jgi:hypothetical protein
MRVRQTVVGMTWVRGRARYEGDDIVIDQGTVREYQPFATPGNTTLAFELAAVTTPEDAVSFARKYGLLRRGPGAADLRESWASWENAVQTIHVVLRIYVSLRQAISGDGEAMEYLRGIAPTMEELFDAGASNDDELMAQASSLVAQTVNAGLGDVGLGFEAEIGLKLPDGSVGKVGRFSLSARSPDLLGVIYYGLAGALGRSQPARVCEGCGRIFPIEDPRQRYHDQRCAQRARYRRWADKKEGAGR